MYAVRVEGFMTLLTWRFPSVRFLAAGLVIASCAASPAGALTVNDFPVPVQYTGPQGITVGPDGNLWFTEYAANQIGRITPAGVITEFPIPTTNSGPWGIVAGSDGNLWFTERLGQSIGRITPTGVLTEFPDPAHSPLSIAAGADGNLWFTSGSKICRITPTGSITEFPVPTADAWCREITAGPDGNLWFAELNSLNPNILGKIGRITTAGVVTEFSLPPELAGPVAIASGPDGNLWFTGFSPAIGRITPSGDVTAFPFPPPIQPFGANPCITSGPDGNLWYFGNRISPGKVLTFLGRVTPSGAITEFPPYWGQGITAGPDGNLWFTSPDGIGQVVMSTAPTPGQLFFVVSPCRVLDTRTVTGPSGRPALAPGAIRTFPIANICNIPSSARAITANLTVTNAGADGDLQAHAGGDPPPTSNSLSFRAGVTRANNGIIRLGADGSVAIRCLSTQNTDVILDVTGFFE
ncbi:MAG: Vgb family protein [Thermoanaerobaculia bacterium]